MNPSYNGSLGGFGATLQGDSSEVVISGVQGNNKNTRLKKILKIIIITVVIIAIISIVVVILWNIQTKKKENAQELFELVGWVSYTGQCPNVTENVNNIDIPITQYEIYTKECSNNASRVKQLIPEVRNYRNSEEYRIVYDELVNGVLEAGVFDEELEEALSMYTGWHKWVIKTQKLGKYQTASDLQKIVESLQSSSNESLRSFASKWVEKKLRLVDALIEKDINPSDPGVLGEYNAAQADYDLLMKDMPDITTLTRLNNDAEKTRKLRGVLLNYQSFIEGRK